MLLNLNLNLKRIKGEIKQIVSYISYFSLK